MKNPKKNLLFISNPFGYGPTGALIPVMQEFASKTKYPITFLGSELCLELLKDIEIGGSFKIKEIDERNTLEIKKELLRTEEPYLISSLNRFAINAARSLNVPNALLDPLAWFWDKVPEGFEYTDIYLYNSFDKKIKQLGKESIKIPLITSSFRESSLAPRVKQNIVFNLGGLSNPLVVELPQNYLKVVHELIDKIPVFYKKDIIVAGGKKAIEYLRALEDEKNIFPMYRSFPYEKFAKIISNAKLIITPAGMGVSFSSISLNKPTVIFLPENLSQERLSYIFKKNKTLDSILEWPNRYKKQLNTISEKEYIRSVDKVSKKILNDKSQIKYLSSKLNNFIKTNLEKSTTTDKDKFVFGGEKVVFNVLVRKWNL